MQRSWEVAYFSQNSASVLVGDIDDAVAAPDARGVVAADGWTL